MSELTEFQREVARTFFSLDASQDFVLTGGAALITQDLIRRSTGDLDLFNVAAGGIDDVVEAFVDAARTRGWRVEIVRREKAFARIEVGDMAAGGIVIGVGVDSAPQLELVESSVGPTFQPIELAARKLLALYGRAEARDFCDLFELSQIFDLEELCELAGRIDAGFDIVALTEALGSIDRFVDADFPEGLSPVDVRAFTNGWRERLNRR